MKKSRPEDEILDGIRPDVAEESRNNYSRQYEHGRHRMGICEFSRTVRLRRGFTDVVRARAASDDGMTGIGGRLLVGPYSTPMWAAMASRMMVSQ